MAADERDETDETAIGQDAARPSGPRDEDLPAVPGPLILACAVIGLEALALTGLGGFLIFDTLAGRSSRVAFGLLSALFALAGAGVLLIGARGLRRVSAAARTPIVVLQVLALPVAYTMAFQAHLLSIGGPILLAGLAVLYLLFTPPVRAVLDRDARD